MSDPVLCIVVYAVFLAAMAAAHFFKTLDNDLGTAWRTAFAVGLAVAFLLFLVRALYPGGGVYITTSRFESFSRSFESVTNIGVRPTLYENYAITIESHILDFDSNVYGDTVRLYFHRLLRREQQFQSAVELTNQIRMDIAASRRYFLRHPVRYDEAGYSFP